MPETETQVPSDYPIESLRPLLAELERYVVWATEGTHDFEIHIPGQKVILVVQTRGRKKVNGHFAADLWASREGDTVHEISLAAENLYRDPYDILETLHHELVHVWNHSRERKDCSDSGRHNLKFKEAALDLGLEFQILDPENDAEPKPHKTHGWAFTTLSPELRQAIEDDFQPDLAVFQWFRQTVPPKPKAPTKMKLWKCGCEDPYKIRTGKDDLAATCDYCGLPFQKDEDSEV